MRTVRILAAGLLCALAALFTVEDVLGWSPSPTIRMSGVWYLTKDDGTIGTAFWAFVNGPSPLDITSFTASGPGGTFTLTPQTSDKENGLVYSVFESGGPIPDGDYTFTLVDTSGRTAFAVRSFNHVPGIPKVDSGITPLGESYVNTTTPALNWDPPPGGYPYQVRIQDVDYRATWYIGPRSYTTGVTVPEGVLKSKMPYVWYIRTFDNTSNPQNYHESGHTTFFTGAKPYTIDLTDRMVAQYTQLTGNTEIYIAVKNLEAAPWNLTGRSGVTTPDNTFLSFTGRSPRFNGDYYYTTGTSIFLEGTYKFEIKDDTGGDGFTGESGLSIDPVPPLSELSRIPEDNAYFPTNTPAFSWDPLSGPTAYYYSLRIYDYQGQIPWYTSPAGAQTSVTVPESVDLPWGSSYQWTVIVHNSDTWSAVTNFYVAPNRTFTVYRANPPGVRGFHFNQVRNLSD
ncbi:MAG: hypothetical protein JW821_13355 [Deltaproteobacteria bacterium]|nr:hypothetical protein [Deltaproteobacteria bacterium]